MTDLVQGLRDMKAELDKRDAEIERLREEIKVWQNQGLLEQCNRQADEIERLNKIIADAPHDTHCDWINTWNGTTSLPCNCWKSRVKKED